MKELPKHLAKFISDAELFIFLYSVVSIVIAIFSSFNDVALGLSILFGSLLAVFGGAGLRGSFYGDKRQKIFGLIAATVFFLVAYWLSSMFQIAFYGFLLTGFEWVVIGFFIGLLFTSQTLALGREASKWIKLSAQEKKLAAIEAFKKVAGNYCQNDDATASLVSQYKKNNIFDDAVEKITEKYKNTAHTEPYQAFLYNFFDGYFIGLIFYILEQIKNYPIEPKEVIDILNRLSLNNEEFRQIHHLKGTKGKKETIKSHIEYLTNIQKYQNQASNNYIVGLRLMFLEEVEKLGFSRKRAIGLLKEKIPFN